MNWTFHILSVLFLQGHLHDIQILLERLVLAILEILVVESSDWLNRSSPLIYYLSLRFLTPFFSSFNVR